MFNAHRRYRVRKARVEGYVKQVFGTRKALITVVFVDSQRCKSINRTFLRHNYVTDVISFCLETSPILEGEVYVNLDRARAQAREYNVTQTNEIARLVIHGCLHLAGYDDTTTAQRAAMKAAEDKALQQLFTH
ncbi:MAG: rRNA maturation RNase YbeY [Ignavibacteriae bacterium]|nr:rRNA maturation RNase YbeY [Ignavibacteriota bacterium]